MNNFTKNGNGTSIDFQCFYDTDVSQWNFRENFERVGDNDEYFFTEHTNIEVPEYKEMFILKNDCREEAIDEILEYSKDNREDFDDMDIGDIGDWLLMYADFGDVDEMFTLRDNIQEFTTRGYSQGDYAKVYVDKEQVEKNCGKYDEKSTEKMIDSYFWDCPVYLSLEIDNNTIENGEIELDDEYYTDTNEVKEKTIEYLKKNDFTEKQIKDVKEFLDENFTKIDYN